jgi:hypothetical protein
VAAAAGTACAAEVEDSCCSRLVEEVHRTMRYLVSHKRKDRRCNRQDSPVEGIEGILEVARSSGAGPAGSTAAPTFRTVSR